MSSLFQVLDAVLADNKEGQGHAAHSILASRAEVNEANKRHFTLPSKFWE